MEKKWIREKKLKKKRTITRGGKREKISAKKEGNYTGKKEPKKERKNKKEIVKTEGNKYKRRE